MRTASRAHPKRTGGCGSLAAITNLMSVLTLHMPNGLLLCTCPSEVFRVVDVEFLLRQNGELWS